MSSQPRDIEKDRNRFLGELEAWYSVKPEQFKTIFLIGPKRQKITVGDFMLQIAFASPRFCTAFQHLWDAGLINEVEVNEQYESRILHEFPHVDPEAFERFLEILRAYPYNEKSLNKLDTVDILNIMYITKLFGAVDIEEYLRENLFPTIGMFDAFCKTPKFLELHPVELLGIVSSDYIAESEVKIFTAVYRWVLRKCFELGIEKNQENMREILGTILFQIRFPLMDIKDFGKYVIPTNILTGEETGKIVSYLSMNVHEKQAMIASGKNLGFKLEPRKIKTETHDMQVVELKDDSYIVKNVDMTWPSDIQTYCEDFNVNQKVALMGVGFVGPLKTDAEYYDITVRVDLENKEEDIVALFPPTTKRLFARKEQVFYFTFDEPIIWDPSKANPDNAHPFSIDTIWKGANTHHAYKKKHGFENATLNPGAFIKQQDEFIFNYVIYCGKHCIVELCFKKL